MGSVDERVHPSLRLAHEIVRVHAELAFLRVWGFLVHHADFLEMWIGLEVSTNGLALEELTHAPGDHEDLSAWRKDFQQTEKP